MNNDDRWVRDLFERHLGGLHPAVPVELVRRRARRGRLLIATSSATALALIAVAVVAVAGAFSPDRNDRVVGPAPHSDQGLIAFTTQRPREQMPWVAVVPATGGEVTRLHEGTDPSWSPDGTRIAFTCHPGICTMSADGSDVKRVTRPAPPAVDEDPDWGPNGSIAYTRNYSDGKRGRDIFVISEGGGDPQRLTDDSSDDSQPSWSPDGTRLAIIRGMGSSLNAPPGGYQLWTIGLRAAGSRQLTDDPDHVARPDWSPNGDLIVFDSGSAIWTVSAGGGQPTKLAMVSEEEIGLAHGASWSPTADRLVFTCSQAIDGNDLCISDAHGSYVNVLLATNENEGAPAWQPNRQGHVSHEQTQRTYRHRARVAKEIERLKGQLRLLLKRTKDGGDRRVRGEESSKETAQLERQIVELERHIRNMKSRLEDLSARD